MACVYASRGFDLAIPSTDSVGRLGLPGFIIIAADSLVMGTLRTLVILVFSAVVLYGGIFALVWREELFGSAIPGVLLILIGLSTFIGFLRVRYRAAKTAESTVGYRS